MPEAQPSHRVKRRLLPALGRVPFLPLVVGVFVLGLAAGIAVFILSGATTDRGTTGSISSEYTAIMAAEKISCQKFGRYGSIATLRSEGLILSQPIYNSVVYVPGKGCGLLVVGSSAYQSSSH